MSTIYLPVRLPKKEAEILEEEAKREGIKRSVLARRLLVKAIRELRLERALKEYSEGRCSLGYAAELAGLTLREFLLELVRREKLLQYSLDELREDFEAASRYAET